MRRTAQRPRRRSMVKQVGDKASRRMKARSGQHTDLWFGLGMFGLVGWSVAVPTLAAIALGVWLDRTWPGSVSWTLTMLFMGLLVGCLTAWRWVQRERDHED